MQSEPHANNKAVVHRVKPVREQSSNEKLDVLRRRGMISDNQLRRVKRRKGT